MSSRRYAPILFGATAILALVTPSHAQSAGDGFLFRVPVASWGLRGGFDHAMARSDIFSFVTQQLTLKRSDFSSATFGSNVAIRVSPATDIVLDISYARVSRRSEFRDWVDQNNLPIEQSTSLRRIPITLGVRHYLTSRGRAIGRFAWIPAARATYVGLGAGMMQYRFRQAGDFVNFQTLNVFPDEFVSQAWTPVLHALAGIEVGLGRFTLLNGEARYTWAKGPMSRDFDRFSRIDLSGLSMTAGFSFRL
ncbi:MAG TPA: hypothetical protein VGQ29_09315 [Gemmatimonadales bacterium]|nr:hypothetical protein [Gemmatimonadales bacterium]